MARNNGGSINFQEVERQLGFKGKPKINPVAKKVNSYIPQLKEVIEIMNRQQAVNRYTWITKDGSPFPEGFDPNLIERMLYYRYYIMVFKFHDRYYSCPLVLCGSIDLYGRYQKVTPVVWNGAVNFSNVDNLSAEDSDEQPWIAGLEYAPSYDIFDVMNKMDGDKEIERCAILRDYTNPVSQFGKPRYVLSDVFVNLEAENLSLIQHNLVSSATVYAFRVLDEGQTEEAMTTLQNVREQILNDCGNPFVPVVSSTDIQELFTHAKLEVQDYWESFVSWDNMRQEAMGIENNGQFHKKERELKGEQELEASSSGLVYADGLTQRQQFCEIFNAIFGEQIWCIESESIQKTDLNQDEPQDYTSGGDDNAETYE